MKYNTLIWDLDGTLMFTPEDFIVEVVNETVREFSLSATMKQAKEFWYGSNRDEVIKRIWGLSKKQFWPKFRLHDTPERRFQVMKAYDDVYMLAELSQKGYLQAILTGASIRTIQSSMAILGDHFQATFSARPPRKLKPHPEGLDILLEILGADISKTLLIGNGQEDIDCGRCAGVDTCLVDRGEYPIPRVNPTYKIKSLTELRRIV